MFDKKMARNLKKTKLPPSAIFAVPEGVSHLSQKQSEQLEQSFASWRDKSKRADSAHSRERMRMIFLLLRHTGARLGEILCLEEGKDFDLDNGMISLGKNKVKRSIPMSPRLCKEITLFLGTPLPSGRLEKIFKVDPGYVRRIFYARAKECGIPKELANPRSLRNTRAVELLRSGVPLAVVRDILGQSSTDLTSVYQHYTEGDASAIVRKLALQDINSRTSARNTFIGHVTEIIRDGVMAEVTLRTPSGEGICAVITVASVLNLGLETGSPVAASIKAPLVNVCQQNSQVRGSARNIISATTVSVRKTEVLAEISGQTGKGVELCALVSARSAEQLDLSPGDPVEFRFKAMSVVLTTV